MNGLNLYAILGVDRYADEATILASYRRLAKLKHPDKNRENPNATSEFQELNKAYSVLRDARLRRDYDQLHPPPPQRSFNTPQRPGPAGPSAPGRHPGPDHASSSASAARAAAATAAENAKTPEQRRAQVDAALRASAARYAYIRHSQRRAFRFMRVPNSWEGANNGGGAAGANAAPGGSGSGGTGHGGGGGPVPYEEDPATLALQDEIHALRRAMQQRDANEEALRRKQQQLGQEMDHAWATVSQQTALLNRSESVRSDGILYGLRLDIQKHHQQIKVLRDKTQAVAEELALSGECRKIEDAKLKELTARYRATFFKKGDDQPPPNEVDPFDEWLAWEPPAHGKFWSDDNDKDEDADNTGKGKGKVASDDNEPDWIPFSTRDADMAVPKTPQWSPRVDAAGSVPGEGESKGKGKEVEGTEDKGKKAEDLPDLVDLTGDHTDHEYHAANNSDSTNVWNRASDDDDDDDDNDDNMGEADLLQFDSDEDMGGALVDSDEDSDEEDEVILPSVERDDYDYEVEPDSGELGDDELDSGEVEEEKEGGKEEEGIYFYHGNNDDHNGNSGHHHDTEMNGAAANNDSTTGWCPDDDLDLDACEAYTEKMQFSNGNWNADFCREW